MRHAREVRHDGVAVDVLAEGEREERWRGVERLRVDDVAQRDDLALLVRHLDADRRRSADALDADRLRLARQREIVAEVHHLRVLHAGGRLELERRHDRPRMVGRHLSFDGELAAALLDEMANLEELLVDLVVDLVLLRSRRQQIDRRQQVGAAPRLAARGLLRRAHGRALQLRLRTRDRRLVEVKRLFEIVVIDRGRRRRDVQLERIATLLLRQLLGRLAQIRLRHLADLEPSRSFDLAHERTTIVVRRRGRAARNEGELRRRVDLLEVLADDRLLHLLLAPPLGEARPLQRQRAAGADELLLHAGEHRTETDARRQQHADEQRRDEHDPRARAVEIRGGGAIDLRAEVAAGGNQRAAQPQLPEREVEQRWHHDGQQRDADQLRLRVLDLVRAEALPSDRQQRRGKEQAGEAEEADEEPRDRRAVVTDRVGDDGVRRGVERGGVVGVVGHEGEEG